MRRAIKDFVKRLLDIHPQSGVKPLPRMRSMGWRRHSYHIPENVIDVDSVCYCIGAGEDISFDTELKMAYDCSVYIFDPTPCGIEHFRQLKDHVERGLPFSTPQKRFPYTYAIGAAQLAQIQFVPLGAWSSKTTLQFRAPGLDDYASYSVCLFPDSQDVVSAPVDRVGNIMAQLGHTALDLIKIEIEGAEYSVIETIIEDRLDIKIILVEFDEVYHAKDRAYHFRIRRCCARLRDAGYVLVHSTSNYKRTFVRRDVYDGLRLLEADPVHGERSTGESMLSR